MWRYSVLRVQWFTTMTHSLAVATLLCLLSIVCYTQGHARLGGKLSLGNDHLHELVSQGSYQLRIDLEDFSNQKRYAKYSTFSVAGSKDKYRLKVIGYTGNAGDSLAHHNGMMFSTKEADHDTYNGNCASSYKGGYWYGKCHSSNLNGLYLRGKTKQYATGVNWSS